MPLNDDLRKKVENFAWPNSQNGYKEVFNLLKEAINTGQTTPQDIFDYRDAHWEKPNKRYVINAETLYALAVLISNSENQEHKKLAGAFCKLAADRDFPKGCWNYASLSINGNESLGISASPQIALQYAQKAVELSKATPHIFKLGLANALRANQRFVEASAALADYLDFHLKKKGQDYNKEESQSGIILLERFLSEFAYWFAPGAPEVKQDTVQSMLTQIEHFLGKQFSCAADKETQIKIHSITQQLYYFQGRFYEILGQNSQAMLAHCKVTDDNLAIYPESVQARARLLKETVAAMLLVEAKAPVSDETAAITSQLAATNLETPASIPSSLIADSFIKQNSFAEHWKRVHRFFDFVYPDELTKDYQENIDDIDTLIRVKKMEFEALQKRIQKLARRPNADSTAVIAELDTKLECLKTELKALNDAKNKVGAIYHQQFIPKQRHILRRGASEARFFNPQRLKNRDAIVALTHQLIDQRFRLPFDMALPVDLTGVSVRRLAAAEKAFQNAMIQLTGAYNLKTGIPIARSSPWEITDRNGYNHSGYNYLGPRENYLIGETPIVFEHREDPKTQRLGDSFSPEHTTYDRSIYPFLRVLVQDDPEKEKQLARLFINFGKKQEPISLAELQALLPSADDEMVHQFNKICALVMAKEQVQWLSATDERFRGLAVMHARCLLLIEKGFLTLAEVFQNDGIFSVYSNKGIMSNSTRLEAACARIESLYDEYLKMLYAQNYFTMFRAELASDKRDLTVVATREQAHQDLRSVYGGESDSDGEEYGSDMEFSGPRL